ncbi:probable serine/threonine-protein kinase DDB_G0282963 isoform X2 [Cotesia glomerata]|uniref:probable serine/threonine-protein kinase DDB_G0282963 isoform X2 n=1 Tax=Cotesia glomerata TaxID=32391 RepID=UPI001D01F746|nr:probable serine/threonine-protein kinase DDB_G0282963 isoform X2 [Cotesia glomerata]
MVDNNCIIEGNVKFRDGKKWKSRWCVMRKLSPVADCLHLQLYGDSKDRYKQGQTKASLSLQHFLGIESGFTLDKESNTIAIICQDLIVVLAFDTRERLIQWQVKISNNLGEDQQFLIIISSAPSKAKVSNGPAHLHIQDRRFCLTVGVPPRLIGVWELAHLRRYGVVEGRFCFEGGSRCGRGEGLHVLITDQGEDIVRTLQLAAEGKLATRKRPLNPQLSSQDSPTRRQFIRSDTRVSDFFPSNVSYTSSVTYKDHEGIKTETTSPCWSSTESRHFELDAVDYNTSCRDTVGSTQELSDQQQQQQQQHNTYNFTSSPPTTTTTTTTNTTTTTTTTITTTTNTNTAAAITTSTSTISTINYQHQNQQQSNQITEWRSGSLPRQNTSGIERCASCISKLGAISKNSVITSSNNTSSHTNTICSSPSSGNNIFNNFTNNNNNNNNITTCHSQQPRAFDRLSLSSYSSSSHDSDYSGSQNADSVCLSSSSKNSPSLPSKDSSCLLLKNSPEEPQLADQEHQQQSEENKDNKDNEEDKDKFEKLSTLTSPTTLPPRPAKPSNKNKYNINNKNKNKKPPMPLPNERCTCKQKSTITKSSPYDNYDIPKSILAHHMSLEPATNQGDQYYDTPRKIKECLALPKNYPNYDTPHSAPQAVMLKQCGCPAKLSSLASSSSSSSSSTTSSSSSSSRLGGCPCHNVMSWAGFVLPYCRRGAGIEPTGVAVHPIKLSGQGKMPVVNANGELAIYPTILNNKKSDDSINNTITTISNCTTTTSSSNITTANNYENIEPIVVIDTQPESKLRNYVNIDFTESLEYYENSRDLIAKTGISQEEMNEIAEDLKQQSIDINNDDEIKSQVIQDKVCNKCGHVKDNNSSSLNNYLVMNPDNNKPKQFKKSFPGYLPMQPSISPHNACSKEIISRICGTKSSSNPTLFGSSSSSSLLLLSSSSSSSSSSSPLVEINRKRSDSELRIPGSAMLSSPYLRRRLIDPSISHNQQQQQQQQQQQHNNHHYHHNNHGESSSLEILWRKRSYSAESPSSNYLEDSSPSPGFSSSTIHKCPSDSGEKLIMLTKDQPIIACSDLKINNRDNDDESTIVGHNNGHSTGFSSIKIRRSSSVPSKTGHNRDSSSSNDSGVSTGSLSHRNGEFGECELTTTTPPINGIINLSSKKKNNIITTICNRKSPPPVTICYHGSLPRKSKSSDPLRELSFQFQKIKIPTKSCSAEGDIPKQNSNNNTNNKGYSSPGENSGTPYIDSRSTSSGTSDMSDYIETLSLSSHSSSDTPDSLRGRAVATTLRPRSGKEYYKIDRSILAEQSRNLSTSGSSYANITPVLEKSESPSPGYISSSPFEQPPPSREHFIFSEEA